MKSEQEPKWSGDIAPSLEALCCRLSTEAERTFDRDGELSGMLFLVEAPGRGQGKVCAPVFSGEHKEGVFKPYAGISLGGASHATPSPLCQCRFNSPHLCRSKIPQAA